MTPLTEPHTGHHVAHFHESDAALAQARRLPSDLVQTWEFAADLTAPGAARGRLADALKEMGHEGKIVDDARLVVTELAANAVVHARSAFSVSLRRAGSGVRILVRDASALAPAMREESSMALSGRGLRLVAALACSWGVDREPGGKVVWAELG